MKKVYKTLFNFNFEGKNIYSNILLEEDFVKKNFLGDTKEVIAHMKKDLSELLCKDYKSNTSIYFSKYEIGEEIYVINIYEPSGSFNVLNDVLAVIGHETLILVDLKTKEWTTVYTK